MGKKSEDKKALGTNGLTKNETFWSRFLGIRVKSKSGVWHFDSNVKN